MSAHGPAILIVGTLDTKLDETLYLRAAILAYGSCTTKILDVSRTTSIALSSAPLPASELLRPLAEHEKELATLDRGDYVTRAIELALPVVQSLVANNGIQGLVSAGGSTGSSLATAFMRLACPIGFPKLMVSTMASGDIKPYIEEADIAMMYSVVDIAGLNSMLKQILSNAAGAIVGMVAARESRTKEPPVPAGKRIAISMFGVTTQCVDKIRQILTSAPHDLAMFEIYIFHATGAGGRAMERLIREDAIDAVIDLTTTEIADELFGGVLAAGPERLDAAIQKGIPLVLSVGACDMVNFGPRDSVPQQYQDRQLFVHNPTVTLMRTTEKENQEIGNFIGTKLARSQEPSKIRVLLPLGGVSAIDKPEQPFHNLKADEQLFTAIEKSLSSTEIALQKLPGNVNDASFAEKVCENLLDLINVDPRQYRLANARRRQWSFDHGSKMEAVRRASIVDIPDA